MVRKVLPQREDRAEQAAVPAAVERQYTAMERLVHFCVDIGRSEGGIARHPKASPMGQGEELTFADSDRLRSVVQRKPARAGCDGEAAEGGIRGEGVGPFTAQIEPASHEAARFNERQHF